MARISIKAKAAKMPAASKAKISTKAKASKAVAVKQPPEIQAAQAPKEPVPLSENVKGFISEIAGPSALKIAESIGDGATDEFIEEKTSLKLAEVRSILNHLHSYGVVEYNRDKNMQNGWFTYTWRVNRDRAIQNYLQMKRKEHTELTRRIASGEGTTVYKCKKGCMELEFAVAMENMFRCPSCKSNMKFVDAQETLKRTEAKIKQIETLIGRNPTPSPLMQ